MKHFILATLLIFSLPTQALELLYFHNDMCGFCMKFKHEIGKEKFDNHELSRSHKITLVILDFDKPAPEWLQEIYGSDAFEIILATPTFVLWDEETKTEVGRFAGYSGVEWFWTNMKNLTKILGN